MNNPRLAQRYAKSLIDIATQYNKLEEVYKDISFLKAIVAKNRDFVLMLESPIINPDKKYKIIHAITSGNISNITDTFLKLICTKGREPNLPGIINSFIKQYNVITGIHIAKLTTATPASAPWASRRRIRSCASGSTWTTQRCASTTSCTPPRSSCRCSRGRAARRTCTRWSRRTSPR